MSVQPRTNTLCVAAMAAAEAGLFVFPVHPCSKVPAVENWEQVATCDPARIQSLWAARPYNLGLAVGRSGLIVIDLDERPGDTPTPEWEGATGGRDVLARLAREAGEPYPAATYTVATPSGGRHLYFRMPDGLQLRNTAGTLGWRIDTRAHGGFVIGAGSVRISDKRRIYYRAVNRAQIAPLPAWLARALTPAAGLSDTAPVRISRGRAIPYVQAAVEGETTRVATATVGTRHDTLISAASKLGSLISAGILGENDAREALKSAANWPTSGPDAYHSERIERDISDGLRFGVLHPRRLDLS
ncbi:MAG: hypothetical protein QOF99_2750 [Pseudonocardiales bacterium]|nr:hypothetical protein [Pseudonocardiales bacterium]